MRLDIGYGTRGELIVIHRSTIVDYSRDANGQGNNSSASRSAEVKSYVVVILISVNLQRKILFS